MPCAVVARFLSAIFICFNIASVVHASTDADFQKQIVEDTRAFGIARNSLRLAADFARSRPDLFGTDLPTIAKQVSVNPDQAKAIQLRPALIQELAWRPQPLGPSSQTESANEVVFSFFNGELFRVAIAYDRYETEGMTADDFVGAISAI